MEYKSLSARRAWIEITPPGGLYTAKAVALRKESVDRNAQLQKTEAEMATSLSARRAWIEMYSINEVWANFSGRSPQGERG